MQLEAMGGEPAVARLDLAGELSGLTVGSPPALGDQRGTRDPSGSEAEAEPVQGEGVLAEEERAAASLPPSAVLAAEAQVHGPARPRAGSPT